MNKKRKKVLKISGIVIGILVFLILASILTFNIVYIKTTVRGTSMYPTLNHYGEDRIFINKFNDGKCGDIVVANISKQSNWPHSDEGDYVVKRLVAKEGDKVKLVQIDSTTYALMVNDKEFYRKTILGTVSSLINFNNYVSINETDTTRIEDGAIALKENEVFLLGDNWQTSFDCSSCGPIKKSAIVGTVDIIVPENNNIVWSAIKGVFKLIF